jgi:hypothetical protein
VADGFGHAHLVEATTDTCRLEHAHASKLLARPVPCRAGLSAEARFRKVRVRPGVPHV